jgi:hypothetical protein
VAANAPLKGQAYGKTGIKHGKNRKSGAVIIRNFNVRLM